MTGLTDWLRDRSQERLVRYLEQNARIVAEVWETPTVAEEFGLDLASSAWTEWRSGNADVTD